MNERLLTKLEETEFCSLSVEDKLEVLVALVDRILNSYSVSDHMEKKIDESKAAWRHRLKVGNLWVLSSFSMRERGRFISSITSSPSSYIQRSDKVYTEIFTLKDGTPPHPPPIPA